ncbi:cell wall hydrolase [Stagnihabitans tardus]|uniref:Cell wall hydrolase n=1 Tax=Stagnihabitans tardus TaxID=2699202 RepID=A0AAE5BWN2_9RHOB|nr:cell wall hydrolase [Stagnihabitans tardus]NBZ88939.1 cell wall hydrolase [Stagnihabitans tardus]
MRLHLSETMAAAAIMLSGAAHADVTVSQSNDPSRAMGAEFATLFGAEHETVNALPEAQLTALAKGPEAAAKPKAKTEAPVIDYSDAWLASLPAPQGGEDYDCLREAIYFESRGEGLTGQFAVAEVILNRVDSAGFPKTVCGVVNSRGSGECAFSYVCDGMADVMRDPLAIDRASRIARAMLDGAPRNLTGGATFFHATYVSPNFGDVTRTAAIGGHLFYRAN